MSSATHRVRVSSQSGHSDLLYSKKWVKVIFFIYGLKNYIEPSDSASVLTSADFLRGWAIFALWWPQTLGRRISAELLASGKFSELFSTCFEIWTWNLVYTSGTWYDTSSLSVIAIKVYLTHFTTKYMSNSFFYTRPHQLYESFKYGTYTYKIESFSPLLLLLCNCIHSWWKDRGDGLRDGRTVPSNMSI